ncbi:MAG: hypothetical protein HY282_17410 [Nitrospirae bacterium]|nr:hypothetical protein [Candidatus Manganitrophaceae bacterium]
MLLILATGLGLLAFHVSSGELQISAYGERELASTYLAEAGVEKILSWVSNPTKSPNPTFFARLPATHCSGEKASPDFQVSDALMNDLSEGPFSELGNRGKLFDLRLFKPSHPDGICTIQSAAVVGKGTAKVIRVEIGRNPLPPITAGVQGFGETGVASSVWGHWGPVRYTGNVRLGTALNKIPVVNPTLSPYAYPYTEQGPNEDPVTEIHVQKQINGPLTQGYTNVFENDSTVGLDSVMPTKQDDIKNFIKGHGGYYVVSPSGRLEQNGVDRGAFDDLFGDPGDDYALAWIDIVPGYSSSDPIRLGRKNYRGYFYFSGNVQVQDDPFQIGMTVEAQAHPWSSRLSGSVTLNHIRLDGLFYALGAIELQGPFSSYGAFYAGQGFTGPGAENLQVWYDNRLRSSYVGVPPVTRLKGTWHSLPISDM